MNNIILNKAEIREEFKNLVKDRKLRLSGKMLLDQENQRKFTGMLKDLEDERDRILKEDFYDQERLDQIEARIAKIEPKIRPQYLIINDRPYEVGEEVIGIAGIGELVLTGVDVHFAHFTYKMENVRLKMEDALAKSGGSSKGK